MHLDRREALAMGVGGMIAGQAPPTAPPASRPPDPTETIELWPAGPPGLLGAPPTEKAESRDPRAGDRMLSGVSRPRLVVVRPTGRPNGAALVVCPGGGYARLSIDNEGYAVGRYLAKRGWTTFVLIYRLPAEGWADRSDVPLADAQRAMRLVRARAARYGVDPARIAAMGFSAGGHLCADLMTRWDAAVYRPVDAADTGTARPRVAAPIYPVVTMGRPLTHGGSRDNLLGPDVTPALEAAHSPDRHVRADGPPAFLCAAEDDGTVPVENTVMLRAALKAAKVPVETHLFASGGHGFGLHAAGKPNGVWPDLFAAWADAQGMAG
jgi:acetyl esterase/lipase